MEYLGRRNNPWEISSSIRSKTDCLANILTHDDFDWPAISYGMPLKKHENMMLAPSTPAKAQFRYTEQIKLLEAKYERSRLPPTKPSPFGKLPRELVLEVFKQAQLNDFHQLANTCSMFRNLFSTSQATIYRGMEQSQYSLTITLYGDSTCRHHWQKANLNALLSRIDIKPFAKTIGPPDEGETHVLMQRVQSPPQKTDWQDIAILYGAMIRASNLQTGFQKQLSIPISTTAALCIDTFHHKSLHFHDESKALNDAGLHRYYYSQQRPLAAFATNIMVQTPSVRAEIREILEKVVQCVIRQLDLMGTYISDAFMKILKAQENPSAVPIYSIREEISAFTVGMIIEQTLRALPNSAIFIYEGKRGQIPPFPYNLIITQTKLLVEGSAMVNDEYQEEIHFAQRIGLRFDRVMRETEFAKVLRKAAKKYGKK